MLATIRSIYPVSPPAKYRKTSHRPSFPNVCSEMGGASCLHPMCRLQARLPKRSIPKCLSSPILIAALPNQPLALRRPGICPSESANICKDCSSTANHHEERDRRGRGITSVVDYRRTKPTKSIYLRSEHTRATPPAIPRVPQHLSHMLIGGRADLL